MSRKEELLALAQRCEREPASRELDLVIERQLKGLMARQSYYPAYTSSLDAIKKVEAKNAQELVIRVFRNGIMYVRMTPLFGSPIYSAPDDSITEAMARCAVMLRDRAAAL